jgi:cell division protein FtsN
MVIRDTHTLVISRQSILLVTAVGVGLLTLTYVLGVQVGKQSSALRQPRGLGAGEALTALPAPIQDQLKGFDSPDSPQKQPKAAQAQETPASPEADPAAPSADPARVEPRKEGRTEAKTEAKTVVKTEATTQPKNEPRSEPRSEPKAADGKNWTLQFVSTPDLQEARRMVARLKAAGITATVLDEKGLHKVRMVHGSAREALDKSARSLKEKGFKPFVVKVD